MTAAPAPERDDVLALLDAEEAADLPPAALVTQEDQARIVADKYLRILRDAEAEQAAAQEELDRYVQHLARQQERRAEPLLRKAAWCRAQLAELLPFLLHGKAKSVKLLEGTLGTRHHHERLKVLDERALLAWIARTTDEARAAQFTTSTTKTITRPNLDALLGYVLETGDAPEGCELLAAGETFYATPTEPGKIAGSIAPAEEPGT